MTRKNYPKLTVEKLRTLTWRMQSHLNGTGFSALSYRNAEHGLILGKSTTGSPKYELTASVIHLESDPEGKDLVCDMLADDVHAELAHFVEEYNKRQLEVQP